ncbi:transcription termination/antitermination protein NusG [Amorphus sp. 3PC139-8]|uniref:transcription termination/antitermination protein NusG n=1 Tax=Amorphus sp. 3PC139-8 TaxID=2735676 RepID=UPI00345CC86F
MTATRSEKDVGPKPWYLAQLKPNAWRIAEKNLHRQGFTVFNPLEKRTVARRGRFKSELQPVFPGYLFVQFDPTAGPWRVINSTYGVARLVTFESDRPQAVPTDLVEAIRARCGDDGCFQPQEAFAPGSAVRFTTGPFAEFVATVEAIAPDKRIWVMLEIMGQETRILANQATVKQA